MKQGIDRSRASAFLSAAGAVLRELARGRRLSPKLVPAFRALRRRVPWRLLMLCVGFVVQAVLLVLVGQLVDLSISLMEVWAELARKHLELTM